MFGIELKLIKTRKLILPASILLLALLLLAFFVYWTGADKKQLEGAQLAIFLAIQTTHSSTIALFFLFWMLQYSIHLQNSGFYKMLLLLGWQRKQLLLYTIFQILIYAFLLQLLNFAAFSLLSFFYGTHPLQLLLNSNISALFSQYLYLVAIGLFALTLSFLKANHVLILPVFIYWILEGWLNNILVKKFELDFGNVFPLQATQQIISENLLDTTQIAVISFYFILFVFGLHFSVQRKIFV